MRALGLVLFAAVSAPVYADGEGLRFLDCSGSVYMYDESWGIPSQLPYRFVATIDVRAKTLSASFPQLNTVQGPITEKPDQLGISSDPKGVALNGKQVSHIEFVVNRITGKAWSFMNLAGEGTMGRTVFVGTCDASERRF